MGEWKEGKLLYQRGELEGGLAFHFVGLGTGSNSPGENSYSQCTSIRYYNCLVSLY